MENNRLQLLELRVSGEKVPDASVKLRPGLNLIIGASDTGKTFTFEAIDFMLGAGKGLRRIPESNGYDKVQLFVDAGTCPAFTLTRAFNGGAFLVEEFPNGRDQAPAEEKKLGEKHSSDPGGSLSAYLLHCIGLHGKKVRRNADGEKRDLSFRDVSHLTLISEERVIQQASPVITGQAVSKTAERNVFAYFLTGQDDSQIIPQESVEDRNARLDAEAGVVESILEEKRAELLELAPDPTELPNRIKLLEASIKEASNTIVLNQEQIDVFSEKRSDLVGQQTKTRARFIFLGEQLKRLRLLDEFYGSDRTRLEGVIEASRVLHEMPEGICPLCNQKFVADGKGLHTAFERACQKEIEKIEMLHRDLNQTISDFTKERQSLQLKWDHVLGELKDADETLKKVLSPTLNEASRQLEELIGIRSIAAQAVGLRATVQSLEDRLGRIRGARKDKPQKMSFENRATTGAAAEFCKVVEGLLKAWKYPNLETVVFDSDKADLVVGSQERTNKGKGYRAITYAAFTIGLMKYCRQKGIPHPGFVIIDTPVNPFKGPVTAGHEDDLSDEVKNAFYDSLASDDSGDQVIIMENEEPPQKVKDKANYYQFTKNPKVGRYGFFPHGPSQEQPPKVDEEPESRPKDGPQIKPDPELEPDHEVVGSKA